MKLLSIVIPTYNMEAYLDRCLSSLIVEDSLMSKLEVIVVNDGSKDKSSEIAHSYESRFPETFVVIDKENGNYGSCVNVGIKLANGRYFRILDADDWFSTDALVSILNKLHNCDADLVQTPFNEIGGEGAKIIPLTNCISCNVQYYINDINPQCVLLHMHSMTYKRSVLDDCNLSLSEGVSYSDTEYCFIPLPYVNTVVYFDDILYQYMSDREGQTMSLESRKRSTQSMGVISNRLNDIYYEKHKVVSSVVEALWIKLLKQISGYLYITTLTICNKSTEVNQIISQYDRKVLRVPELNNYISSLCMHHIHYVEMWRKTGRYYTNALCQVHNFVWTFIDPIWLSFLKRFIPSKYY